MWPRVPGAQLRFRRRPSDSRIGSSQASAIGATAQQAAPDPRSASSATQAHSSTESSAGSEQFPAQEIRNSAAITPDAKKRPYAAIAGAAVVLIALVAGGYFFFHRAPKLTGKDSIVLADITNTTGDPVFDGTLRQGLAAQLGQSPFLNIVSDDQIAGTLRFMGQPPDARLTKDIARQVCERAAGAAVIAGSIAKLDNQYVVGISAVNCHTGEILAQEQVTADDKAHVLAAVGTAATEIRGKLGESHDSLAKFDVPLEQATTPSLEALQAFNLARQAQVFRADYPAAIQFSRRAVELDPNFAMAYAVLGTNYSNQSEPTLAAENLKKAFDLRERVSETEKLYITTHYYDIALGNFEKAAQEYQSWTQTYPRDDIPINNLVTDYQQLGLYEKAVPVMLQNLQMNPSSALAYGSCASIYLALDRFDEAQAMVDQAYAKKVDSFVLHSTVYLLSFLHKDQAGMAREAAWGSGKPGIEDLFLFSESDTALYAGDLQKSRELLRRAMTSATRADEKEVVAGYQSVSALHEALIGNASQAKQEALAALKMSTGRDVEAGAGIALAIANDLPEAQRIAADMDRQFPQDTWAQSLYLPELRASLDINRHDPQKAIEDLKPSLPYELASTSADGALLAVYVRGQAYLAARDGSNAAAEFQKIIDHRGVVVNAPIGVLAHLGLGRAFALQADNAKARAAYQDFFGLWQHADPGIPILAQARAEFAKLL